MPIQTASSAGSATRPWLEYALATLVYSGLAVALYLLQRPILFWLCVVFAFASAAGAAFLQRSHMVR